MRNKPDSVIQAICDSGTHPCSGTEDALSRKVEGELDDADCAALAAHVEHCAPCDQACRELRAALTGKLRAGGRKPWLAASFPRLFPPVPHGGVAR